MKILCIIDSLGSGGAQRQIVELAKGFKEKGHDVAFLTYHPQDFYLPVLKEFGISVLCVQEKSYINRFLKMRNHIRKGKYNVVLSFLTGANLINEMSALPYKKWKVIVGERNADPNILRSRKLKLLRWFHIFSNKIVSNSYENIQLVSKAAPFLPKSRYEVVYNLIDLDKWAPKEGFQFLNNDKIKIVVAASHIYRKNSIGLIEALNLLSESEKSRIQIDWYGDGISPPFFDNSFMETKLKLEQYNLSNIIRFYPATPHIHDKIKEADVVGLFSFNEGLPNIVCEGMACGKLVIASNVSDIPLLIKNPQLRFNPNDIASICSTLRYVLTLKVDNFVLEGGKNREFAVRHFNRDKIVDRYLKIFQL